MKKMRNNRTLTLLTVMVLSLAMCVTNIAGFINAVHAEEIEDFFDMPADQEWQPEPEPAGGDANPGQPFDDIQRQAEEAQRQAQEAALQEAEAQRLAAEEAERQAQEAAARQAQEAEIARQAEEAKKLQEAEEARRAEEIKQQQAAEAAKLEALAREAKEAEEEAKRQQEAEAAAQEAIRKAQEEEQRAREEAERAKKAEEEAKRQQEADLSYGLRTMIDGGSISNLTLSAPVGSGDNIIFSVVNNGIRDVDLVYGISRATSDVFSLTLVSGSTNLKIGDMDKFQIAYNAYAPVGIHTCTIFIKDKQDTENNYTSYINITADVKASSTVTKVNVYPQEITLAQGGDCTFHAQVTGTGDISGAVQWNVTGARTNDTYITSDGTLKIGRSEPAGSLTVVATSVDDGRISGLAKIAVQANSYNVNVRPDPGAGGMVTGGGAVAQGGSVTLSAVPNKNFYFEGWERDGRIVSTATNYTINDVRMNMNVIAKFKQNYVTVDAAADNYQAGSVVGGGRITYGGSTTISAKAYDGFVFTGWKEGDSIISTSPSLELKNVTVNRKFTARFAKTKYNITLASVPSEGGSVQGGGTYNLGDKVTINAKAQDGYTFQGWTVNDQTVSRNPSYTIERIDRDYCINAVFIKNNIVIHSISAGVATTGGTISPSGVVKVARNSSITFTMTPKSGFAILAVAVDGVQVGPVSTYTFKDVTSDHNIAVAFLQTDAGMKKAAESGSTDIQTRKVQKVFKEETPESVPEEEQVVDLEDAANGTAGDEFIAEMDLSEVEIPTDEDLGITEDTVEPAKSSELLESMGITMTDAQEMINSGNTEPILVNAWYDGLLDTYAENQYAPPSTVPDYHVFTREQLEQMPDDDILPYLPNFDVVVAELMGTAGTYELAEGGTASVNVSLTKADSTISEEDKKILDQAVGQRPLKYFDITMVMRIGSKVTNVKELNTPMQFVIEVPDEIFKKGRTYSVLRSHDGRVSVLPDLDDNPKTITFSTDRFSSYAISVQRTTAKELAKNYAVGALITFLIAVTCFALLMYHHILMKRRQRSKIK